MKDINRIRKAFTSVRDAVMADFPVDMIESRVKDMFAILDEEEGDYVYSFEELQLVLDIQETGILLSVLKGNLDEAMLNAVDLVHQYEDFEQCVFLSEEQKWQTQRRLFFFEKRISDLYNIRKFRKSFKRTSECKCMLCRKGGADATNSHIVPRFIVQKFFNLDGSSIRDKEAVDSWSLQDGESYHNFGTDASAEIFNKVLGFDTLQCEIDEYTRHRTLSRDYVFCKQCEKRFGVIETAYSEILRNPGKSCDNALPYLFWLSVVWRMSVVSMGIKLAEGHEEKLRKILNSALAIKREDIVTDTRKLGHCAYIIAVTNDTRDETLGVFGHHQQMIPYVFIIGNMVFNFYPTTNKAQSLFKRKGRDLALINDGTKTEVIQNLSFIDFWLAKRTIFDTNNAFHGQRRQPYTIIDYSASLTKEDLDNLMGEDRISFDRLPPRIPGHWKISIPRSIMKIKNFIEAHPGGADPAELKKTTGYTEEEMSVMISYYEQKIKPYPTD